MYECFSNHINACNLDMCSGLLCELVVYVDAHNNLGNLLKVQSLTHDVSLAIVFCPYVSTCLYQPSEIFRVWNKFGLKSSLGILRYLVLESRRCLFVHISIGLANKQYTFEIIL
jgi:hypothetical protein